MSIKDAVLPRYRAGQLRQRQEQKKAASLHAYVRGSSSNFYEWLDNLGSSSVPQGPAIWICGDCHIGNLGPIEAKSGTVELGIRDLDQTVIGNPAHDLLRLALSLVTEMQGANLPGATTIAVLERIMGGYWRAIAPRSRFRREMPKPISVVMRKAHHRTWKGLCRDLLQGKRPVIPLGRHYWPLTETERAALRALAGSTGVQTLVRSLKERPDNCAVELLDAAYWVKGCSSLGHLRYALLFSVSGESSKELCMLDIKEALRPTAPRYPHEAMPRNNALRIVRGARALTPALGKRMLAAQFLDRAAFVREVRPQDLKIEAEKLTPKRALECAAFLAHTVGRAHARQLNSHARREWSREVGRNHLKKVDAPDWFWATVVRLLAQHETAYLEHCRRFGRSRLQRSGRRTIRSTFTRRRTHSRVGAFLSTPSNP